MFLQQLLIPSGSEILWGASFYTLKSVGCFSIYVKGTSGSFLSLSVMQGMGLSREENCLQNMPILEGSLTLQSAYKGAGS